MTALLVGAGPYGLALLSAVVHAGWNVALAHGRGAGPGPARNAAASGAGVLLLTPFALLAWRIDGVGLLWAGASACAELAYFVLIGRAYQAAPVSRIYPVARGAAPVVVLVVTAVVAQSVAPAEAGAVLLVALGVVLVAGAGARPDGVVVRAALPVSLAIATYTVLDSHGVQHASPVCYLWLSMAPVAVVLLAWSAASPGVRADLPGEARSPLAWLTGAGIMTAYGLVLLALSIATRAQVPVVAALRETSVVLVPVLAALVARRRPSAWVLVGSGCIGLAVVLLQTG